MSVSYCDEACFYDTTLGSAVTARRAQLNRLTCSSLPAPVTLPHGGSHSLFAPIPVNQGLLAPLVPIMVMEIEMHSAWGIIIPSSVPSLRFSSPYSPLMSLFNRLWFAATTSLRLLPQIILNADPRTNKVSVDKHGVHGNHFICAFTSRYMGKRRDIQTNRNDFRLKPFMRSGKKSRY